MNLTSLKIFLSWNEVKLIIIGAVTGGILQLVAQEYLKQHPEFLEDVSVTKENYPRGGALIEISGISVKIVSQIALSVLAKKGLLVGIATSGAIAISKIPATAISRYLRDALPQNLAYLNKKKFILIDREEIYLAQCDQNLKYLFDILEDELIPFEEKKRSLI